jgi:BASS family bile acid:Na+ symporter
MSALIYLFANEWLEVSFLSMLWSVVQVVLIPIALGINNPVVKIWCLLPPTTIAKINEIATTDIIGKAVELPIISVVAISLILAIVVGGSKHQILTTGLLIFLVVMLHNVLGYTIGYWLARLLKLDRN